MSTTVLFSLGKGIKYAFRVRRKGMGRVISNRTTYKPHREPVLKGAAETAEIQ